MGYDLIVGRLKNVNELKQKVDKVRQAQKTMEENSIEFSDHMLNQLEKIEDEFYNATEGDEPFMFNGEATIFTGDLDTIIVEGQPIELIDISTIPVGTRYIALYHSY